MPCHGKKASINIYICGAIGAIVGWFIGGLMGKGDKTMRLEAVALALFGALAGGAFIADMVSGAAPSPDFALNKLVIALACSGAMLCLLALMRKLIGPAPTTSKKSRNRS